MDIIIELWKLLDNKFQSPLMQILALGSIFLLYNIIKDGLPRLWKFWRDYVRKEKIEREKQAVTEKKEKEESRNFIIQTNKTVKSIEEHIGKMNGTIAEHITNNKIHFDKSDLATKDQLEITKQQIVLNKELFVAQTIDIKKSIENLFDRLDHVRVVYEGCENSQPKQKLKKKTKKKK